MCGIDGVSHERDDTPADPAPDAPLADGGARAAAA